MLLLSQDRTGQGLDRGVSRRYRIQMMEAAVVGEEAELHVQAQMEGLASGLAARSDRSLPTLALTKAIHFNVLLHFPCSLLASLLLLLLLHLPLFPFPILTRYEMHAHTAPSRGGISPEQPIFTHKGTLAYLVLIIVLSIIPIYPIIVYRQCLLVF